MAIKIKNIDRRSFARTFNVEIDATAGSNTVNYAIAVPYDCTIREILHGSTATSNYSVGVTFCGATITVPSATAGVLGKVDSLVEPKIAANSVVTVGISAGSSMTATSKLILSFSLDGSEK
jgi:hypothetical protein